MAKPSYGGWVSFTVHLSKKFKYNLYKIGKRTEINKNGTSRLRNFGYDVTYQNISPQDISKLDNILITAIDKNYYDYLEYFPDNTTIVIHDPTEVKGKSCQILINNLSRFKVVTIRETVKKYLKDTLDIDSIFLHHPFYEYPKTEIPKTINVSISRLDFDKHTDIILKANNELEDERKIHIYGAKNDLYIYHHIKNKLGMELDNYKGTFSKSFSDLNNILGSSRYVIDLSAIRYDGGGSQYTFLEALYHDCVLILNDKWVNSVDTKFKDKLKSPFKNNINCLVVKDEKDLINLLKTDIDIDKLSKNAKIILEPHISVNWDF